MAAIKLSRVQQKTLDAVAKANGYGGNWLNGHDYRRIAKRLGTEDTDAIVRAAAEELRSHRIISVTPIS